MPPGHHRPSLGVRGHNPQSRFSRDDPQAGLSTLRSIYDPLLTQLNLSPEQRARFYDLHFVVSHPGANLDKGPDEAETAGERAQIEAQIRQAQEAASA
jgi:hypothetical protein